MKWNDEKACDLQTLENRRTRVDLTKSELEELLNLTDEHYEYKICKIEVGLRMHGLTLEGIMEDGRLVKDFRQ